LAAKQSYCGYNWGVFAYTSCSSKNFDVAAQIYCACESCKEILKEIYCVKLGQQFCIGLTIVVNENVPIKYRQR
jgi:hypothetical protein